MDHHYQTNLNTISIVPPVPWQPRHDPNIPHHTSSPSYAATLHTNKQSEKRTLPVDDYSYQSAVHPLTRRPSSPDTLSRVSASSSFTGPPLRKRPKILSIKNTRPPTSPRGSESPNVNAAPPSSVPITLDTTTVQPRVSTKSRPRADSGNSQQHSPIYKRPPASHSSYGVETTCGPPPTYCTQRTLSTERIKKIERSTQIRSTATSEPKPSANNHDLADAAEITSTNSSQELPATSHLESSPESATTQSVSTPVDESNSNNITVRTNSASQRRSMDEGRESSSDERKSEDLFLNIARVDAAHPVVPKHDKRRSRISLPFLPSGRTSFERKPSPVRTQFDQHTYSSPVESSHHLHKRSSLSQHALNTARPFGHDGDRFRDRPIDTMTDVNAYEGRVGRRTSNANIDTSRFAYRSGQGLRSTRLVSESAYVAKPKLEDNIASESTVSTTAPSTVWDELDDLKSRIRKLELTGKIPGTSAAAMSATERPRTATTQATTMSTSPKFKSTGNTLQSPMEGVSPMVHPLLHEALGNAKQVLSNDVYQKLHTTAQDALQITAMMGEQDHGESSQYSAILTERHLRRKVESMCRGLTELAIALTTEQTNGAAIRPGSRDINTVPGPMLRSRRYSNDQGDRQIVSRAQSRIEGRRASAYLGRAVTGSVSPERGNKESPTISPYVTDSRQDYASTIARNRRNLGGLDGAYDQAEESPSIRPGSRAMTDIGIYRRASKDYGSNSREYTSRYPMPGRSTQAEAAVSSTPLPPHISANFTSRRKYGTPPNIVTGSHSSPMVGRGTPSARELPTRFPIITPGDDTILLDSQSEVHNDSTGRAGSASRHSLGYTGRIGTSVSSRLRAARSDRAAAVTNEDDMDVPLRRDRTSSSARATTFAHTG